MLCEGTSGSIEERVRKLTSNVVMFLRMFDPCRQESQFTVPFGDMPTCEDEKLVKYLALLVNNDFLARWGNCAESNAERETSNSGMSVQPSVLCHFLRWNVVCLLLCKSMVDYQYVRRFLGLAEIKRGGDSIVSLLRYFLLDAEDLDAICGVVTSLMSTFDTNTIEMENRLATLDIGKQPSSEGDVPSCAIASSSRPDDVEGAPFPKLVKAMQSWIVSIMDLLHMRINVEQRSRREAVRWIGGSLSDASVKGELLGLFSRSYPSVVPLRVLCSEWVRAVERGEGAGCPVESLGWVLIAGGMHRDPTIPNLVAFNVESGAAAPLLLDIPLPSPFVQNSMTTFDGIDFYVIGNFAAFRWTVLKISTDELWRTGDLAAVCHLESIPLTFDEESECRSVPPYFFCHTAIPFLREGHVQCIAVFGGASRDKSLDTLYEFDVRRRRWSKIPFEPQAECPPARLYHTACDVRNERMYVFGGAPDVKTTVASDPVFDDLWCYTYSTRQWRLVRPRGDVPSRRGSCVFEFVDPYVYLFGGFNGKDSLKDFYRLDVVTEVWQKLSIDFADDGRGPLWGSGHCVVRGDGYHSIVIVGGYGLAEDEEDEDSDSIDVHRCSFVKSCRTIKILPQTLKSIAARKLSNSGAL